MKYKFCIYVMAVLIIISTQINCQAGDNIIVGNSDFQDQYKNIVMHHNDVLNKLSNYSKRIGASDQMGSLSLDMLHDYVENVFVSGNDLLIMNKLYMEKCGSALSDDFACTHIKYKNKKIFIDIEGVEFLISKLIIFYKDHEFLSVSTELREVVQSYKKTISAIGIGDSKQ